MTPERWQRIEKLYHDALELDAGQRAAFLNAACADDDALRCEIESLLAANDQTGGLLDGNALSVEAKAMAAENLSTSLQIPALRDFSHYRILSKLGAGGMGEVFLARDERLERRVAIKILPPQFTADPSRLHRFAREAKAASALNHPNIITIYEVGETETTTGNTHFIATEFIEGETLRVRMARGLKLREALKIAGQVASALDAAHQAGIIHRDIKPENIMIRPDGLVKVLDFGLAKLGARKSTPFSYTDTDAQTAESGLKTEQGTIMGTLRYMSPEQARGHELDARSDIFSLGAVLYEMIARRPLFAGETSADIIAAIIHKEPEPLRDFAPDTPAELERIVLKTLAKDSLDRYQTALDLRIDLESLEQETEFHSRLLRSGRNTLPASSGALPRQHKWRRAVLAVTLPAGLLLVWAVGNYWSRFRPVPSPPRITKLFDTRISSAGAISRIEFSPDGNLIAYSISKEQGRDIWVKQFSGGEARQVTDGKGKHRDPVWSPDGQRLAFIAERASTKGIWSVPYLGGESPKLIKEMDGADLTLVGWAADGQTIYYSNSANLFALNVDSGVLTHLASSQTKAPDFRVSPNGEQFVYLDKVNGESQVFVAPTRGGAPRQITFERGSHKSPAWFSDNQRIAFSSNRTGRYQIYLGWADGREPARQVFSSDDNHTSLTVSPAGNKIISLGQRENANIYSCDLRTGKESSHTGEFGIQLFPEVSFNGQQVAFQYSDASLNLNEAIGVKSADPESKATQLAPSGFNAKWSPAGNALAFVRLLNGKAELLKSNLDGRAPILLAEGLLMAGQTGIPYYRLFTNYQWAPDGNSLAYLSAKSGQENLWTVAAKGASANRLTNNADSSIHLSSPCWSPDGKKIAYISGVKAYFSTGKRSLCVLEAGKTATLFENELPVKLIGWSASGKELYLGVEEAELTRPQKVTLLKIGERGERVVPLGQIAAAYLHSLVLSFDRQQIAVISRIEGRDNIEVIATANGAMKQVTNNNDPTAYYSGLTWSPDGKTVFYSKQTNWVLASLTELSDK